MRTILAVLALIATAGCQPNNEGNGVGWHYRSPTKLAVPRIDYVFRDPNLRLIGRCDGGSTLILVGGDYDVDARHFTLTVDDKSWELPATQHIHGRFLRIDEPLVEAAVTRAQHQIIIRVGEWERKLPPSPLLQTYARDCG